VLGHNVVLGYNVVLGNNVVHKYQSFEWSTSTSQTDDRQNCYYNSAAFD